MLSIKSISKAYEEAGKTQQVLKNVSFSVEKGQTLSIVGASGSGKSTLLHIISTLDSADSGDIYFSDGSQSPDINLCKMSEQQANLFRKQNLGIVFQRFNLIDCIDVHSNILLPAKLKQAVDDNFLRHLVSELGIKHLLNKLPIQLSGGEQQRVAIARALSHKPHLVLADEPTGNLDSKTSDRVSGLLIDSCVEANASLILVTHSDKVAALTNKQALLNNGNLTFSATKLNNANVFSLL